MLLPYLSHPPSSTVPFSVHLSTKVLSQPSPLLPANCHCSLPNLLLCSRSDGASIINFILIRRDRMGSFDRPGPSCFSAVAIPPSSGWSTSERKAQNTCTSTAETRGGKAVPPSHPPSTVMFLFLLDTALFTPLLVRCRQRPQPTIHEGQTGEQRDQDAETTQPRKNKKQRRPRKEKRERSPRLYHRV